MIDIAFQALSTGLTLWKNKDARKYLDEVIKLKQEYYIEDNKEVPNDSLLDNITHRLRVISQAYSSQAKPQDSKS